MQSAAITVFHWAVKQVSVYDSQAQVNADYASAEHCQLAGWMHVYHSLLGLVMFLPLQAVSTMGKTYHCLILLADVTACSVYAYVLAGPQQ